MSGTKDKIIDALIEGLPFIFFMFIIVAVLIIVFFGLVNQQNAIVECVRAGGEPAECEDAL